MASERNEILIAIDLHGGITPEMTNRHGWTNRGLPVGELRKLIDEKIVAPRVLTSHPLRVVFQRRATASHAPTLAKIESESRRLGLKEYAEGGFQLTLRPELKGKI